jgi:hypothetical protein
MKRVTTTKPAEDLDRLKMLAAILNFDWEGGDARKLEKLKSELPPSYPYWWVVEGGLKDRGKAKAVQNELKADLLPIFAPEGNVEPEAAHTQIDKLVHKLNEAEFKTKWDIDPVDYEWEFWGDPAEEPEEPYGSGLAPLTPDEVNSKIRLLYPSTQLNLLGHRWYFGRTFPGLEEFGFSRQFLYQIILDAFRNGSIARFRTCMHCKAFFVAEDARQQFCNDEHRNEFNNKKRLKSGYFSNLRHEARAEALKKARALKRQGKSPTEIEKETGLSLRILKREGIIH